MNNAHKNILTIHGPNLNLLGLREPQIYGHETLDSINQSLKNIAEQHGISIDFFQSNHEGAIIDRIQLAHTQNVTHIMINPAAYTHTSIAILDSLLAVNIPYIEIHLSNIYARESMRQHSYFSKNALGVMSGFGAKTYLLALQALIQH